MALSKPPRVPLQEVNGKTKWNVGSMKRAIDDVTRQIKGLRQAAREYGVPVTTLKRRIDCSLAADCKPGPSTTLLKEEEEKLVNYILTMAQRGFGLSPREICTLAHEIANTSGRNHPFKNGCAGKHWYNSFTQRHNLSLRMPQPLSYARAKNCHPEIIEEFFDRLSGLYTKHEFSPSQIYNADETGVSCVHKLSNVCAKKGPKTVWAVTSGEKGRTNTILACGSASGHSLPPMIIFPRERISLELIKGAPPGTLFTGTKYGWINGSVFFKWIQFFVAQIPPQRPVLLLYDGHASHISS